jgi:hypothetical protein
MRPSFINLADAAEYLASAPGFMKSFNDFGSKANPWFYSFNPGLAGGVARPKKFASWNDWHGFKSNQILYLCRQAGLNSNAIAENRTNFDKLHEQWQAWPTAYHVVNWATTTAHGSTCNIFLGECLTLCNYEQDVTHNGKYLSAQSYWNNQNKSFLQQVKNRSGEIARGMIMAYRYSASVYHLEVITSKAVGKKTWFGFSEADEKTTFRSRGGGRTGGGDGEERQGDGAADDPRTISNPALKIFRLKR